MHVLIALRLKHPSAADGFGIIIWALIGAELALENFVEQRNCGVHVWYIKSQRGDDMPSPSPSQARSFTRSKNHSSRLRQ